MKTILFAIGLVLIAQSMSSEIPAKPYFHEVVLSDPGPFLYESEDYMLMIDTSNEAYAINKHTHKILSYYTILRDLDVFQHSLQVDSDNQLWGFTNNKQNLLKLEIQEDLTLKVLKNITNPTTGAYDYGIKSSNSFWIMFDIERDSSYVGLKIVDPKQDKIIQIANMTKDRDDSLFNLMSYVEVNSENIVMFWQLDNMINITAYDFESQTEKLLLSKEYKELTYGIQLSESNTIILLQADQYAYFNLEHVNSWQYLNYTGYTPFEGIINSSFIFTYDSNFNMTLYALNDKTNTFESQWSFAYPVGQPNKLNVAYCKSKGLLGYVFNSAHWLFLDTNDGHVADSIEVSQYYTKVEDSWQKLPAIGQSHVFDLGMQSLTMRNKDDLSFQNIYFFRGLGFYQDPQNTRYWQVLALEEDKYTYYKLDLESGEFNSVPLGSHNQTYNDSNYYTAAIDSTHNEPYVDAIYMNHYGVWVYYSGNTYLTDIIPPQWGLVSDVQAIFDYENLKAKFVKRIGSLVTYYELDLEDNMKVVENKTLSNIGTMFDLDQENLIIQHINTSTYKAELKIFNLQTQSFIWSSALPQHQWTAILNIIPLGVKIENNSEVVEGKLFIVTHNDGPFIYDIKSGGMSDVTGFNDLISQSFLTFRKVSETAIGVQLGPSYGIDFYVFYEFDWDEESKTYEAKFLEIFE